MIIFRIRKDLGQILPRRRVTRSRLAIVEIEGSESEGESIGDLAPYDNGSQVSFLAVVCNNLNACIFSVLLVILAIENCDHVALQQDRNRFQPVEVVVGTNLKIIDQPEVRVEVFEVYVAQDKKTTKKTMKKRRTII